MGFLIDMLREAWDLLTSFDPEFRSILWLTLLVSGAATAIGVVVGVPLGVALGAGRFRGRGAAMALVNTGMGMPPVLAGLVLLLLLWNDGPLGAWGLLFTPIAMIAAQALLAIPIAAGVTAGAVRGLPPEAHEQVRALQLGRWARGVVLAREAWPGVAAGAAAAFGRVVSEVGAVLVVGGNIEGETRVLTTAIVQEARRADFGAALALGIVLLVLALTVNAFLTWFQLREA
ncbi:MAG: ABC transporter permease [Acidimicrobiia bacterium]